MQLIKTIQNEKIESFPNNFLIDFQKIIERKMKILKKIEPFPNNFLNYFQIN